MRKCMLVVVLAAFACCSALMLASLFSPTLARDNGQWKDIDPKVRQWFREQKSPQTGGYCCNESDGTYAEEEIREGHYWTRFEQSNGKWIPVPTKLLSAIPTTTALLSLGGFLRAGFSKSAVMPQERCVMAVVNAYPVQNPAPNCAYCGEPFKQKENHLYAWRSSSGKLYCSEFCADDEAEATSNTREAAPMSRLTTVAS